MRHALVLTLTLLLLASGCALRGGPDVLDPVGSFEFQTQVQGQTITGTLEISGEPGAYEGRIVPGAAAGMGPIPLTRITVEEQELRASGNAQGEPLEIRIVFEGDEFEGSWSAGMEGGQIQGQRTG